MPSFDNTRLLHHQNRLPVPSCRSATCPGSRQRASIRGQPLSQVATGPRSRKQARPQKTSLPFGNSCRLYKTRMTWLPEEGQSLFALMRDGGLATFYMWLIRLNLFQYGRMGSPLFVIAI